MLVLAGALHSGQLVLNCSTWRRERAARMSRAAVLSVAQLCSTTYLVPQVVGSIRRLRIHLLSLQGKCELLCPGVWGVPGSQGLLQSPPVPAGHTAGGSSCSE